MTSSTESPPASRARFLHVVAATWLLLISAAVVVDHVAVSRLAEDSQASAQSARVAVLEAALSDWAQRVDAIDRQPPPLTQENFAGVRQAIEERLARIEQAATDYAAVNELTLLQERMKQLEARVQRTRQTQSQSPSATPARRPLPAEAVTLRIIEPPFRLLGIESRAGERFLSIAPADSQSLAQVRVLRPGETESGWRLDALDERTATFSFEGEARPFPVPREVP